MIKLTDILLEFLLEKKADRCLRIARQKYDKPSAYRSGAIVRCRRGEIWKDLKEEEQLGENYDQSIINRVFESNPELSSIGTSEQYGKYLSTIFPSSKIKDIVYHASPSKIEKFRDTMFGTYFSYSPIEGVYGNITYSVLLNVKNPLIKPKPTDSTEEKVIYDKEYRNYNNPSSPYDASIERSFVTKEGTQIRVKTPEQIHILGSKQDVEGFKRFISTSTEAKKEAPRTWKDLKEVENQIQSVLDKTKTYKIQYNRINQDLKKNWIPTWKIDYDNDLAQINELVARHLLYKIAEDLVGGVSEIEFKNKSKSPTNHFQMEMYLGNVILFTAPFIYVDDNHKIVPDRTKIELLNEDYDTLHILNEDESLHKWFNRQGAPGKSKGWVDCNTCREVNGKMKCRACGRQKGEKRAKYPSCRPTPSACKQSGKGKKWGKTK